jgi:hypothetical protein
VDRNNFFASSPPSVPWQIGSMNAYPLVAHAAHITTPQKQQFVFNVNGFSELIHLQATNGRALCARS